MNSHYPRYNFRGKVNSFSYFIADPAARAATATVTITVNNINDPPTITSDGGGDTASLNVVENQTGVIDVESSDPDGDTEGAGLTYSLAGADQGLFSIASDTGVLTFNAPPDFEIPGDDDTDNVYEIQVTVTDSGGLTDVQELSVTVADVDDPPQAVDGAVTVDEDSVNTLILVLSNDTDVDGGPISISSLPQPPDGTVLLVNAGTTVSYTPDAGYCNDGIPTDDFTYTLTPGGSSATVQVTVTCLPDPPLAGVDNYTSVGNTVLEVGLALSRCTVP